MRSVIWAMIIVGLLGMATTVFAADTVTDTPGFLVHHTEPPSWEVSGAIYDDPLLRDAVLDHWEAWLSHNTAAYHFVGVTGNGDGLWAEAIAARMGDTWSLNVAPPIGSYLLVVVVEDYQYGASLPPNRCPAYVLSAVYRMPVGRNTALKQKGCNSTTVWPWAVLHLPS